MGWRIFWRVLVDVGMDDFLVGIGCCWDGVFFLG